MLKTKTVQIKISKRLINKFKKDGYTDINIGDVVDIDIKHLPLGSHVYVDVVCDICGKEKNIMYQKYIKNIKNGGYYSCSSKCSQTKVKNTTFNRYGAEYYTQTIEYNEKIKKTCIEKYGVEHHTQSDVVKKKIKNTCVERYGVENPSKNIEIKNKIKEKFIEKYGVENISHLDRIKDIISEKVIEKQPQIKESRKKTLIDRYGVDHMSKIDGIQDKIKITNLNKYGVTTCLNLQTSRIKQQKTKLNTWITNKMNDENIIDIIIDKKEISYKCEFNHITQIGYKTYYNRHISNTIICTECNPISKNVSGLEIQLLNFIKDNYDGEIITNTKYIIKPYELDIYLPELNLAFEFNGLYWHNELNKDNSYHNEKTNKCNNKNTQLIHIWEDDWLYKQNIVKSMILNKLGKNPNKIFARKCDIKIVENKIVRQFLNDNHIQGFVGSSIKIGLFFEDELVSLMTFGKKRAPMNSKSILDDYEMLRFCNKIKTTIIGGASKLFKYFVRNYNPSSVVTYADRSYSNGNLYNQLGFKYSHTTIPNYHYIVDGIRQYRYNYRKDILVKEGFDPNKTEHEIMLERKIFRIYNAGNLKYEMKF